MSAQLGFADKKPAPPRGNLLDTRIGGLPVYFKGPVEPPPRPICKACGKPLYLVAQIFAPTDRDRSLLIWGCNANACNSLQPVGDKSSPLGSWHVQRTQSSIPLASPVSAPEIENCSAISVPDPWGACAAWGDELAISAPEPSITTPTATSEILPDVGLHFPGTERRVPFDILPTSAMDKFCFPAFNVWSAIDVEDDGCTRNGIAEDSDEDDAVSALSESPDVAARRWREYEIWRSSAGEDDAVKLEVADFSDEEELDASHEYAEGGDVAEIGTVVDVGVPKTSPRREAKSKSCARKGKRDEPCGGGRNGGDEYEATPAALRIMLNFQAWLRRSGHPCVRYAYGLSPRWSAPPSAILLAGIPRCPCGSERKFEMQLLPSLLVHLMVDDHTDTSEEDSRIGALASADALRTTSSGVLGAALSKAKSVASGSAAAPSFPCGGMDFSTVLIFSCPDSCEVSDTEFAIAVPNN
jgi:hypothetical protein